MPLDASIYGALGTKPMSVADYDMQTQQLQQNALNLQRGRQQLDAYTQDQAEKASLRNYLSGAPDLSTAPGYNGLMAAAPTLGPGIHKAYQDSITSQALAAKDNAQAKNFTADAQGKTQSNQWELLQHGIQALTAASSPDQARQAVTEGVSKGYWSMEQAQQKIAQIPTDPAAYQDWRIQQLKTILPAADLLKANAPNISTHNTGSATQTLATDPLTGATRVVGSLANTQSPDNAATNATSRANNRDTIAAENARAGVTPGGALDENSERTAQAIAAGQLPAPTGMALLNPKNQRMLGRVMEINPQYDSTTVSAKKAAATAFTTGAQGVQLNKFATTGEHLDQLLPLVDALHNGDNQTINAIGNAVSKWNGGTAVTNFDAVKAVATKEMMAALVAGGGDAAERKELSDSLKDANAPQQLKQVISAYRGLMAAKEDNLMEQRRAAGLPESTLPKYHKSGNAAAPAGVPDDIAAILAKHGAK